MFTIPILFTLLSCCAPQSLSAQHNPLSDQSDVVMSGEVASVDPIYGMIMISHEPDPELGLGLSTDSFRVSEPSVLNAIKPGAHIRFAADRVNGQLGITKIFD